MYVYFMSPEVVLKYAVLLSYYTKYAENRRETGRGEKGKRSD